MPYLTPENVPEERACRALLIPESSEWLAIFSGALTTLAQSYNWQEQGITVEEALAVVNEVIAGYYSGCIESGCEQPGGYALLRTGEDGHVQQLIDGEWTEPQGINAYPAVPARSESTPDERRCLAAANAAFALQELYEQVSEVAQYSLGVAELIIRVVEFIAIRFFWAAPIINGIMILAAGILELLLRGAFYITSDVWDSTFDGLIVCFLYECSTDTGDVVTFDYDCLMTKLYDENVAPPWNEMRARLAAQLALLIPVVGGVDSINQFGTLTGITEADCDTCENTWCYVAYFEETDGGFVAEDCGGVMGTWTALSGWNVADVSACGGVDRTIMNIRLIFDTPVQLDSVDMHYDYEKTTSVNTTEGVGLWVDNYANPLFTENQDVATDGLDLTINATSAIPQPTVSEIDVFIQPTYNGTGGVGRVIIMQLTGHEEKPTFLEALGWVECPPT